MCQQNKGGWLHACGKWFGVYDEKDNDICVGVSESTAEVCAYFGGIKAHRVSKSVMLDYSLTFGSKRYRWSYL